VPMAPPTPVLPPWHEGKGPEVRRSGDSMVDAQQGFLGRLKRRDEAGLHALLIALFWVSLMTVLVVVVIIPAQIMTIVVLWRLTRLEDRLVGPLRRLAGIAAAVMAAGLLVGLAVGNPLAPRGAPEGIYVALATAIALPYMLVAVGLHRLFKHLGDAAVARKWAISAALTPLSGLAAGGVTAAGPPLVDPATLQFQGDAQWLYLALLAVLAPVVYFLHALRRSWRALEPRVITLR
jgi:hypothetical protein